MTFMRKMQIIAHLNARSYPIPRTQLAEALEIHERTLRRDIEELNALATSPLPGLPFVLPTVVTTPSEEERRAYVSLERRFTSQANLYLYAAVYTAISHVTALDAIILGPSGERALDMLKEHIPADFLRKVERLFHYQPFVPKRYTGDVADQLEDLLTAVTSGRPIRGLYQSLKAQEPVEKIIEPYSLVMHRDAFYVLGWERTSQRTTVFSVDRFKPLEILRHETVNLPDGFRPAEFFRDCLGVWKSSDPPQHIVLAFSADGERVAVEREVPGFVKWQDLDDGRSAMHIEIPVTPDLVSWIVSWRAEVEVLEPLSLREQVSELIQSMAALYA